MDKIGPDTETKIVRKPGFPDINEPPPEVNVSIKILPRINFSWHSFVLYHEKTEIKTEKRH